MDSLIDTIRSNTDTTKFSRLIKTLMSILIKQQFFEVYRTTKINLIHYFKIYFIIFLFRNFVYLSLI